MYAKLLNVRAFPVALAVILALTLMMIIRSGQAVSNVVSLRNHMVVDAGSGVHELSPSVILAAEKDSLLAKINGAVADPFRGGDTRQALIQTSGAQPAISAPELGLNGLLYAEQDPVVQLGYGQESSGWLHVGDEFQGWRVESISQRNVTLRRGGTTRILD